MSENQADREIRAHLAGDLEQGVVLVDHKLAPRVGAGGLDGAS